MAYSQGQIIEATGTGLDDFNEIAALINEVYGDSNSGNRTVGTGDFGYGQSPEISTVSSGDTVTAAQWTSVLSSLAECAIHQGTSLGGLGASVSTGQIIEAFDSPDNLISLIADIRNNRLNIAPTESQTASKLSRTRSTDWTDSVTHEVTVTFGSLDEARHFFNSGGELRWSSSYTPGVPDESGEEAAWQSTLASIGVFRMGAVSSTAGSGVVNGIGYMQLSNSYQTIVNRSVNAGGSYYTSEAVTLEARTTNASHNVIQFRITYQSDPAADRILNGTLVSQIDQLRSIGQVTVTEPTYSDTFSGS